MARALHRAGTMPFLARSVPLAIVLVASHSLGCAADTAANAGDGEPATSIPEQREPALADVDGLGASASASEGVASDESPADGDVSASERIANLVRSAEGCVTVATTAGLIAHMNAGHCIHLKPGRYVIDGQLPLHPGQILEGVGAMADQIVIAASATFPGGGAFGLIRGLGAATDHPGVVSNLTLDAARVAYLGIQGTNFVFDHAQVFNARCNGISILGSNDVVVSHAVIRNNGASCPVAPPGAGVYVHGGNAIDVLDSHIENNIGPAIDINSVQNGAVKRIARNAIGGNTGWAAVSLFDTKGWQIYDNTISHSKSTDVQRYHPACRQFPGDFSHSAALLLCGDSKPVTGNYVAHNRLVGSYGILLTGNGSYVPVDNSIYGNDVFGSSLGCADHSSLSAAHPNRYNGVTNQARQCWAGNVVRF